MVTIRMPPGFLQHGNTQHPTANGANLPLIPLTHLKKREKGTMPGTILICGSPADGFQIVGLFADSGDAESYAEDHSLKDWWIAELTSPEAFAESQRRRFRAMRGPMWRPTPKT